MHLLKIVGACIEYTILYRPWYTAALTDKYGRHGFDFLGKFYTGW